MTTAQPQTPPRHREADQEPVDGEFFILQGGSTDSIRYDRMAERGLLFSSIWEPTPERLTVGTHASGATPSDFALWVIETDLSEPRWNSTLGNSIDVPSPGKSPFEAEIREFMEGKPGLPHPDPQLEWDARRLLFFLKAMDANAVAAVNADGALDIELDGLSPSLDMIVEITRDGVFETDIHNGQTGTFEGKRYASSAVLIDDVIAKAHPTK